MRQDWYVALSAAPLLTCRNWFSLRETSAEGGNPFDLGYSGEEQTASTLLPSGSRTKAPK
jgi:hypothetical protein